MAKGLKLCALLFGAALVFGCAKTAEETATPQTVNEDAIQAPEEEGATKVPDAKQVRGKASKYVARKENDPKMAKKLVRKAKTALGTPYVLGGSKPGGFDCSGLVKWTYNSVGVDLPRTAREQSAVGQKINNIEDMREGDIVAFRHPKRGYHTGIYIGDGKFVHSPRKRSVVRISSLDEPYFNSTLLGARRVVPGETSNVVADAESRLEQYLSQRGALKVTAKNEAAFSEWPARNITKTKKSNGKATVAAKKSASKNNKSVAKNAAKKNSKSAASVKNDKKSKNSVVAKNSRKTKAAQATAKTSKNSRATVAKNSKSAKSTPVAVKGAAKNAGRDKKSGSKNTVAQRQAQNKSAQNAKAGKASVASQQSKKKIQSRRS